MVVVKFNAPHNQQDLAQGQIFRTLNPFLTSLALVVIGIIVPITVKELS